MSLIFHHLVPRDFRVVLRYYEEEGEIPLAEGKLIFYRALHRKEIYKRFP